MRECLLATLLAQSESSFGIINAALAAINLVTPAVLGPVKSLIGHPDQFFASLLPENGTGSINGGNANADGYVPKAAFAVRNTQVSHRLAYPFGNAEGLFLAGLGHDNGKFFAAVAKNFVGRPQQHRAHGLGNTGKAVIARR